MTHFNAKLAPEDVRAIWRLARQGSTPPSAIAAQFGVSRTTIGNILRRQSYRSVEIPPGPPLNTMSAPWNRRLCDADVVEIFRRARAGEDKGEIGRAFGVARSTVYQILQRRSWTHVEIPEGGKIPVGPSGWNCPEVPDDLLRSIVREVAAEQGVAPHLIFAPDRRSEVVRARHAAIRRVAAEFRTSTTKIGKAFGMNHTTVIYVLGRGRRKASTLSEGATC